MTPESGTPTLVMAAHGARSGHWESVMDSLTARVRRARPAARVELGFLEISAPLLSDVLSRVPGPVVVVPMLLAGGYHAHIDLPAVVARTRP
ncbi:CbiX/SirB N-terminal domain-containing protein, partial [Microbispora sp. NPDC049633]|uniref:sirohydrochlorin chelatase n=1 Tax=Microbispora sp. NPDC049633 TaxID=3154355 RepID=UPI003423B1F6